MLDMLTRLLLLASLPLLLLETGGCTAVGRGVSKGFVLVGGAAWGGGSTGRLVRGALEGVAFEGVAGSGVGRCRWWPLSRGEAVRRGGGGDKDLRCSALSIGAGGGVRDLRTDSRNSFSASMQDAGSSCSSFLAA